jgi:hypothetical protein
VEKENLLHRIRYSVCTYLTFYAPKSMKRLQIPKKQTDPELFKLNVLCQTNHVTIVIGWLNLIPPLNLVNYES